MNAINKENLSEESSNAKGKNPFLGMQAVLGGAGAVLIATVAVLGVAMFKPGGNDLVINMAAGQMGNMVGAAEDAKIGLPYPYYKDTYVAGNSLSELAGEDNIYQLEGIKSEELVNMLKKAFNVSGKEMIESGEGWYSVSIGSMNANRELDYNGEYINISGSSKDAVLYWSYSNNSYWNISGFGDNSGVSAGSMGGEFEAVSPDGATVTSPNTEIVWEEPAPSDPNIIKTDVNKIMASLGYHISSYELYVDRDYATATILLDGEQTPVEFYFNFYENSLVYAGGYGVKIQFKDLGVYPLLSEKDSVARLNNNSWWASAPSFVYRDLYPVMPIDESWLKEDKTFFEEESQQSDSSNFSVGSEPYEPGIVEHDTPDYATPEPTERTLTMNKAVKVWVMVWSVDGNIYLVRGYVMTGNDYAFGIVNAVPDSIIKMPNYDNEIMTEDYSK